MIDETEKIRQEYLKDLIGKEVEVLFENETQKNVFQGYTKNYLPVRLNSDENIIGKMINVKITDYCDEFCIAE